MNFSRRFSRRSAAAALLAACVGAAGANAANAANAVVAGETAAPHGADVQDHGGPADQGPGGPAGRTGDGPERGPGAGGDRGPDDGPRPSFGAAGPGVPGPDAPPHHGGPGGPGLFGRLHRLNLSEAQQDKLFAITHAAAPQQRAQEKARYKAQEALRALDGSAQFDEAKANAAARDLGQAIANDALLRARLEAQVLAVLTPEQREQLRKERPPGPPGRP